MNCVFENRDRKNVEIQIFVVLSSTVVIRSYVSVFVYFVMYMCIFARILLSILFIFTWFE